MNEEKFTLIESHMVLGHGSLLQFIESSKTFGSWLWSDCDQIDALKKVAAIDDKHSRDLMLLLIQNIELLNKNCCELRKRIDTIGKSIVTINECMK